MQSIVCVRSGISHQRRAGGFGFADRSFIYVMEFKLEGTAEEALKQINEKHYARPFESDKRKLFKIGVNFSAQTRNIEKWMVES